MHEDETIYWILLCAVALLGAGCRSNGNAGTAFPDPAALLTAGPLQDITRPSNHRPWKSDLAVLSYADLHGPLVTVHNVRDFVYQSDHDFVIRYENRTYDLRDLRTVDFLVVPFQDTPSLAHTMLSFGFRNGRQLAVSVEARLEEGETYSPLRGSMRQFELMYVVADERDLITRRTRHRDDEVFLYPTIATPQQAQELFVDVMQRVNRLAEQPEFYDTLTNNCATNIVQHVNRLRPGRVPYDVRVLLPGFSDKLAYDLGLLRSSGSFEATRAQARVSALANRYFDQANFSQRIRRR